MFEHSSELATVRKIWAQVKDTVHIYTNTYNLFNSMYMRVCMYACMDGRMESMEGCHMHRLPCSVVAGISWSGYCFTAKEKNSP